MAPSNAPVAHSAASSFPSHRSRSASSCLSIVLLIAVAGAIIGSATTAGVPCSLGAGRSSVPPRSDARGGASTCLDGGCGRRWRVAEETTAEAPLREGCAACRKVVRAHDAAAASSSAVATSNIDVTCVDTTRVESLVAVEATAVGPAAPVASMSPPLQPSPSPSTETGPAEDSFRQFGGVGPTLRLLATTWSSKAAGRLAAVAAPAGTTRPPRPMGRPRKSRVTDCRSLAYGDCICDHNCGEGIGGGERGCGKVSAEVEEAYALTSPFLGDEEGANDGMDEAAGGDRFSGATPFILVVMGVAGTLVLRCRMAAAYERFWPGARLAVRVGQA